MVPKFRAWDKEENLWIKVASLVFDEEGEMWYLGPVMDDFNPVYYENELGKTWEIMQSTGLKDKNGVEIFEGDIIVWEYSEKPQEVFWDNSICGFSTKHYHLWRTVKKVKVIGNIYENPELLEPANEN